MKLSPANEEGLNRLLEDTERLLGDRARVESAEDRSPAAGEDRASQAIRIREAIEAAD